MSELPSASDGQDRMESFDRRTLLLGLIGVAGAGGALAGCSGGSGERPAGTSSALPSPTPTPAPVTTSSPPAPAARWPLSGALLTDEAAARHAPVAVKVPDNVREHPQVGLDKADIVFVELDGYRDASGYSGTRLMPVFHSRMPDGVAPVRSMRPVDVPLLAPFGAVVGNTGATGWVLAYVDHNKKYLDGSRTYLATKGTGAYSIDRSRVRVYQGVTYYDRAVVCHPKVLAKQSRAFADGPQQPYFPFAETDAEVSTAAGKQAVTVRVPWKRGHTYDMSYRYDDATGRYLRSMPWGRHVLANGTRVATDNILVIRATQEYTKIYPGRGGAEPVHGIVDSKGTFVYAHGGRAVTGTWTKGAVQERFRFTVDGGEPLRMAPGQTYVELARKDADVRIA
ncbi:DUF3048 domain-containing protein [Kineosporia sp. R_H_3]|uniref:DUF3048 domain-containing protein n=1 Tax=Kineosporia sp. R_H_3 TaxID=1961848 RepID=UPI0013046B9D|nr:DUF3048 domain-containing protein [Kineosporia sp. R_H_3]